MLQRVMIAMAISLKPRVLIADEPTTALDVTIQAQILDLLKDLNQSHDMAILLITHDFGVVAETCDRVLVMYAGQIIEMGSAEELLQNPAHPYTKGLLRCIPTLEETFTRLESIEGTVPSLRDIPPGCRFFKRCPMALESCGEETPPWREVLPVPSAEPRRGEGSPPVHRYRCFRAE
jgi:oligopeptide/dipeptide ABC transporter ATP-binding protein